MTRIDLGHGAYLEPDEGPRNTPHHRRIVAAVPIPNTRSGHSALLECGHYVRTFGDITLAGGVVLCLQCRDAEAAR